MTLAHPTANGIVEGADTNHPNPSQVTDQEVTDVKCSTCNKPVTALLKTPHGWVCSSCFKLVYVPQTSTVAIKTDLPYNSIESYEVEGVLI